ncbi:MAG: MFS transporter [Bacillota bacterium]
MNLRTLTVAEAEKIATESSPDPASAATGRKSPYPPGATNANWFNLFNAISWQITMGSPAILYAKSQGASETILGIIAAFTPLLSIFQLPAAKYLPKYGYRRFILAGWGTRTLFIFGIAAVPLLSFVPAGGKLALLLLCLFSFNLVRGITAGAWWPWISELIPEHLRGRFLSRDQVFTQIGSLTAIMAAAIILHGHAQPWQFTVVFLISAAGATVSLLFLNRTPDTTSPENIKRSGHRVPWGQMLAYRPFLHLVIFNLIYLTATQALAVFPLAYLRTVAHYSEGNILWLFTSGLLGALVTVPLNGRIADRYGSKPVMRACVAVWITLVIGWFLISSRYLHYGVALVAVFDLLYGIAYTNYNIANNRLAMATMPLMGRNHFFALYTVFVSLASGLSPIGWGLLLDVIGPYEHTTGVLSWNRYSIYFACVLILAISAGIYSTYLTENVRKPRQPSATPLPTSTGASA